MSTFHLPLLSCRPSKQRRIATYFGDDTDRYGKQNEDIDGCTACDVIEVNGRHERYPLEPMPAARFLRAAISVRFAVQTGSLTAILATAPISRITPKIKNRSTMEKFPMHDMPPAQACPSRRK